MANIFTFSPSMRKKEGQPRRRLSLIYNKIANQFPVCEI